MKRTIIFIIIAIGCFFAYAEEKKVYNGVDKHTFKTVIFNSEFSVSFYDDSTSECYDIWNQSFTYRIITDGKFYSLVLENKNVNKTLLALKSDYCLILYDAENSDCCFLGMAIRTNQVETVYFPHNIKATSELEENNIRYEAENITNAKQDSPWSEGVPGEGIGQALSFDVNASSLIIVIGYISSMKKYLYEANSRPKKITINFINLNKRMSYNLMDTPNPQLIDLETTYSGTIEIIIEEVYEGVKYKDTCINSIICKY